MKTSEAINEIIVALVKAQAAFKPVKKDATNPMFKSGYATFDALVDTVKGPLAKNGLAFSQMISSDENGMSLETVLFHESGQWFSSTVRVDALQGNRGTNAMQALGASLTYMKRYTLGAMLGTSTDEDVDGNAPSKDATPQRGAQTKSAQPASKQTTPGKYDVASIVICEVNTKNGKRRQYGFKASGDKWPRVKVWSREDMLTVAPFIGLFYRPDDFGEDKDVGTEYPMAFNLTHTEEQYPKPLTATFDDASRDAMTVFVVGRAERKGIEIEPGQPTDEWFTAAVAKLRGDA